MDIRYGLVGDSSLYTKRENKKKSLVSSILRNEYRFVNLTERIFPGGGVQDLKRYLEGSPEFDVLGISYFGNEHTKMPMNVKDQKEKWNYVFHYLRRKVHDRAVFFIGGYSEKYSYGPVYDENLSVIKRWVKDAGFEVVEARQEVKQWELAADRVHFSVDALPDLAAFWNQLLMDPKFAAEMREQPQKQKRHRESEMHWIEPAKKAARKDHYEQLPLDEWEMRDVEHQALDNYFKNMEQWVRSKAHERAIEKKRLEEEGCPWRRPRTWEDRPPRRRQDDWGRQRHDRRSNHHGSIELRPNGPSPPSYPPWDSD